MVSKLGLHPLPESCLLKYGLLSRTSGKSSNDSAAFSSLFPLFGKTGF
uniref:Uncharacterized protein n=1 Tax=Rhizophora mucronata TaxID=61149 RepID=A0A2P2NAB1_RHIMU